LSRQQPDISGRQPGQDGTGHGRSSPQYRDLDFVAPAADETTSRDLLPIAVDGYVCCIPQRARDSSMRAAIRSPHKRAKRDACLPEFYDLVLVAVKFASKGCCGCVAAGYRSIR